MILRSVDKRYSIWGTYRGILDKYWMEIRRALASYTRDRLQFVTTERPLSKPPRRENRRRSAPVPPMQHRCTRPVATPRPPAPHAPPPLLPIDNIVLCDYDGLDPAGRWCDCPEPLCPHAAYLTTLYPSVADARQHAHMRAERYARLNLPAHRQLAIKNHRLWVRRLRSSELRGRDYRDGSCRIPNALDQLRDGRGREPAWLEIKRQRVVEGADAALLPSACSSCGELFLYASALELVELGEVEEELRYPFWG